MVSIFEINSQKKKNDNQKNLYIRSGGNTYGINPYLNKNRGYTSQMEKLDKELADEGLKIERLSDKDKRSYVNSLTDTEYSRLMQYKNAGYSFGASKALLDMEKQQAVGKGGYRGAGFQIAEPLGGMDSTVNKSNIIGYVTEKIDDRVQNTLIPKITVTEREEREQELLKKYNNMSKEDWDKVYQDFLNDPNAKRYEDDSLDYTLKKYWEENNKSFRDKLRGAGLTFKEGEDGKVTDVQTQNFPSPAETIANVPSSALANATAVIRGRTNPLDNLAMLAKLIGTKEGRDLLAYRYLNEEGRNEAIEKDPVGWVLDLFDFGALGGNVSSKVLRTVGTAQRLVGATEGANRTTRLANNLGKASDSLENVADMGLTRGYDNILNKALGRLSEGGRGANLIGDYISLTQRPLATLRAGANPKDEKGNYIGKTNGAWTINGVQNGVTNVLKSMKDKIQTQATGLTPEVRERIRQNPFIKEYRDRIEAMILDEGLPMDNQKIMAEPIQEVGQELLRRLEEYESRLQEDGKEYQILDKTTKPYNISAFLYGVYDVFAKNGISLTPDGELDFRTTANPADMNPVKVAWNLIRAMEPNLQRMTIKEIREFRQQLRSLIKYQSDAPSTKYSKKVLREIVDGAFNKVVHKEIPGLAKVDELYTKRLNELREFKDGLVYQVGEKKGQIKDNFYSIISTLNTQNRQKMKARVEKLFPDLGARVEAIRMLPILAKTYQNSPQMMRALFQRAGFLGGIAQSGGVKRAVMGWLLGIVADELFAKPMGEKRRKKAIDDLLKEVSPEALQKLAEIKSKVDAGIELSEQEKQDLATAMQEVAMAEYEYLDEQHKKEFDKIMKSANNQQPKLPQPGMDVINPDGTITLGMGNQLNSPETYKPKTREERVQEIQNEYEVEPERAEEMTNSIEDFLDDIGGDINGEINPREVNYDRFSTRTLEKLMDDDTIPRTEKDKIEQILMRRGMEGDTEIRSELDQEFAHKINKLTTKERKIANMKQRNKAQKEQLKLEEERDKLKVEMRERYAGQGVDLDQERVEDKYAELEAKPIDYIEGYKKSKRFQEDEAEKKVLDKLRGEWEKQPKFIREMSDGTANQRDQIVNNELQNGYERETTEVGDRFINKQTGDKGAIKYNKDGTIEAVFTEDSFRDSGVLDILPDDALVRFAGEPETIRVSEIRPESEYQTVGRANPNEKDITAEEGLAMKNFRDGRTVQEIADDYGLEVKIVDKIFTEAGEEALGRAKGNLIELIKEIKEGTAPHEVFHPIFNMVDAKRRAEIIDLVRKNKGMTEKEAKEWLADNFSEYFRTGKFDTKPIPKGFVNKVKWFFNKVKEFLNGTRKNRKKIQKLFDDILEGKIETDIQTDMLGEYFYNKKGGSPLNLHNGRSTGKPPKARLSITDGNSSVYKNKLDDLRSRTDSLDSQQFIDELRGIFVTPEESNYLFRDINGEPYTLRVADHGASTKNYKNYKQFKNNTSVVVEFTKKRWRSNDVVDLLELRYDKDTLTDSQKKGIIDGIKDWMDTGEYTDKQYNSKKVSPKTEEEYQYQIQQKSLFEADDPLNGYKSFDYAKLNDDISALYDIANPVARDNNYTWDAFLNQLGNTYDTNLEARKSKLEGEGIKVDPGKLVRIYNGIRKIANEPRSEFVLKKKTNNIVMNALNKITEKMKIDPLDIPMEYGEMNNALKQQDWSPLERYLEKHPENINALWKTYDPDVVEWRDNLEKKFTGGGYISLTELYEIKNMIDDYIKAHPEDTKIEGTIDDVGIKFLVDKARYREKNNGKIGSYDKRQIEKVGFETNEILSNRITEVSKHMKSIDPDEYNSDFVPEVIRELGKTYDPDIEQWQKNLEEPLRQIIDKYGARKAITPGKQIVTDSGLNGLKAKIKELEKYSHEDIFNAFEGQEAEVFFRAVKPRIEELKAKGAEKAVTNLVAISNLEEGNLRKLVENFNGKDPMPSIAVMDVNVPHEVFGDITLVFGRDTVDPKVDERNKIYGSDAWTPTFPRIKETGGMSYDNVRKFASDTVDNMIDNGVGLTPEEAGYLSQDIGNMILEFDGRSDLKKNADHLAEQVIEDLSAGGYADFIENNEGAITELQWKIENFLQSINNDRRQMIPAEYFLGEKKYYTNADYVAEELVDYVSDEVRGYYDEGDNRLLIRDITKTLNKMHDFQSELLEDLGSEFGIEDSDRVRTLLDTLKMVEQGDRPLTPENVLIAMRNQRVNRENAPGSYRDMIEIEGAKLNDIEDVRRQNFAKVFHGDRTGDLGDLEKKYDRLFYTVAKDIMGYDDTEIIQSQNMLRQEIKRSYDKDVETFKKNLVEENEMWDAVPNEVLQRIIDVVEQGKKIPIRFSESKPERIVNLMEEVQYILVPEGADASQVKSIVRGTPLEGKVVEYKPDNNSAPRSKKLKELQKKYGNVFFSMGGVIMPIAMLLLMMQQGDEDQGEGQQA